MFPTRRAATEWHPVFPVNSQATGARQRPDRAPDKLGGSREVVRTASTTKEVTLMKGHHGAQVLRATAYETPFGPVDTTCRSSAAATGKRAADGVAEAVCALGRAELHTEQGDLLLKKLSQGAGAIELMVDIVPAGVPHIACLRRLLDAYRRLLSNPHARPGAQGSGATQRQNHETTVTVPLRPGAGDHSAGGARSRGRRVPIEGVLLRFFRGGAQTTRTGSSCFLWTGQPDPRD